MFRSAFNPVSLRPGRVLPCLEQLEARNLLTTNYLIMDFTPDDHSGSFADTFSYTRTSSGYAPRFLDFNNDGYVNRTDASIAAGRVAAKVQSFFSPFLNNYWDNLHIYYGDVLSNTNWGSQWINYGRYYSSVEVAVMYIGGASVYGSSILGRSPVANDGQNVEGYGDTYSRTIAQNLLSNPYATPTDFVNRVANTAAHEFGHMLGLRHTATSNSYNLMSPNQSSTPGSAYFVYGSVLTSNWTYQNAYAELDRSFQWNQAQVYAGISGGQFQHDDGDCDGCGAPHSDGGSEPTLAAADKLFATTNSFSADNVFAHVPQAADAKRQGPRTDTGPNQLESVDRYFSTALQPRLSSRLVGAHEWGNVVHSVGALSSRDADADDLPAHRLVNAPN